MAKHDSRLGTLTAGWGPDVDNPFFSRVSRGELPARYAEPWISPFFEAAGPVLNGTARILDVGAGRDPLIPKASRRHEWTYVGLDVDASELDAAGEDAYDQAITGDVATFLPELEGSFDLIISWQVLEHVAATDRALANMRRYLRPGGRMVALLSGRYAVFSLFARVIPYPFAQRLMEKLLSADPDEKFPTRYEACDATSLSRLLSEWTDFQVLPRYRGAAYFSFSRILEKLYISYEDWSIRSQRANLATHYLVWAVK